MAVLLVHKFVKALKKSSFTLTIDFVNGSTSFKFQELRHKIKFQCITEIKLPDT